MSESLISSADGSLYRIATVVSEEFSDSMVINPFKVAESVESGNLYKDKLWAGIFCMQ